MHAEKQGPAHFTPTHIGIDLGTTFCCQAYIDHEGNPQVIPSAEGELTTPSVLWFDGSRAYVGKKANERKIGASQHVKEFIKRDIGKPVSRPPDGSPDCTSFEEKPHLIAGYRYGATGLAGLLLRKLKRDALKEFKRKRFVPAAMDEKDFLPNVVITVPAYFNERQRRETKLAGEVAGLNVIGMVNEPTAAAYCYAVISPEPKRIMVFDLGGGTFDVTILEMHGETASEAKAMDGDRELGGKDWDALFHQYLYEVYRRRTGHELGVDGPTSFDVQQKSLVAKLELSEALETVVSLVGDAGEIEVTLKRRRPEGSRASYAMNLTDDSFYFEERATELLLRCRRLCENAMKGVSITTPGGGQRPMSWSDLDEVVLAGGSCRMPMIPIMLEEITRRKVRRNIPGFNYDTAIAIGAALRGLQLLGDADVEIIDVVSHSIGIEVERQGRTFVNHLLKKNTALPLTVRERFSAPPHAVLNVYEGESTLLDECELRGRMELQNPGGDVDVTLHLTTDGVLIARVRDVATEVERMLEVKHELFSFGETRRAELRQKVQSIPLA